MPSIAVTNLDHSNFGDISVLFGKETIDAGENKANKVYSADAWTPTVPSTEYEANYDVTRRAQNQIEELTSDNDYFNQMARGEFSHYNAEQLLNRTGGLKGYIDRLMDKPGYMGGLRLNDINKQLKGAVRKLMKTSWMKIR